MRRDNIVEVKAVDVQALFSAAHRALIAYQDAERAEQAATVKAEQTREEAARRRLELGRELIRARKAFPRSGPKAAGWGKFLADLGLTQPTAFRYMQLAGYVEVSCTTDSVNETPDASASPATTPARVPTYAEAGIKKSPFAAPAPEPVTDERREAAYRREVEATLPPKMEVREKRTHEVVEIVATARANLARLSERGLHLTDVTTSPDDFMRAKQMLIDITNRCLDELAQAGVLDGKEQRRQLVLLEGGRN